MISIASFKIQDVKASNFGFHIFSSTAEISPISIDLKPCFSDSSNHQSANFLSPFSTFDAVGLNTREVSEGFCQPYQIKLCYRLIFIPADVSSNFIFLLDSNHTTYQSNFDRFYTPQYNSHPLNKGWGKFSKSYHAHPSHFSGSKTLPIFIIITAIPRFWIFFCSI